MLKFEIFEDLGKINKGITEFEIDTTIAEIEIDNFLFSLKVEETDGVVYYIIYTFKKDFYDYDYDYISIDAFEIGTTINLNKDVPVSVALFSKMVDFIKQQKETTKRKDLKNIDISSL